MAREKSNDNAEILEYALKHLENERDQIQARIDSIYRQLGRGVGNKKSGIRAIVPVVSDAEPAPVRKKRVLSEAARKRIAAAQKRRWAEHRKQAATV